MDGTTIPSHVFDTSTSFENSTTNSSSLLTAFIKQHGLDNLSGQKLLETYESFVGDASIVKLVQQLEAQREETLISLDLSSAQINKNNLEPLLKALQVVPCVTSLNMSDNDLGDYGVSDLMETVVYLGCLEELILESVGLTDNGIVAIGNYLKNGPHLRVLKLGKNKIQGNGLTSFVDTLVNAKKLETLSLNSNQIDDRGTQLLCKALKYQSSIAFLDLSNNKLGFRSGEFLQSLVSENSVLKTVNIDYNNVANYQKTAIQNALNATPLETLSITPISSITQKTEKFESFEKNSDLPLSNTFETLLKPSSFSPYNSSSVFNTSSHSNSNTPLTKTTTFDEINDMTMDPMTFNMDKDNRQNELFSTEQFKESPLTINSNLMFSTTVEQLTNIPVPEPLDLSGYQYQDLNNRLNGLIHNEQVPLDRKIPEIVGIFYDVTDRLNNLAKEASSHNLELNDTRMGIASITQVVDSFQSTIERLNMSYTIRLKELKKKNEHISEIENELSILRQENNKMKIPKTPKTLSRGSKLSEEVTNDLKKEKGILIKKLNKRTEELKKSTDSVEEMKALIEKQNKELKRIKDINEKIRNRFEHKKTKLDEANETIKRLNNEFNLYKEQTDHVIDNTKLKLLNTTTELETLKKELIEAKQANEEFDSINTILKEDWETLKNSNSLLTKDFEDLKDKYSVLKRDYDNIFDKNEKIELNLKDITKEYEIYRKETGTRQENLLNEMNNVTSAASRATAIENENKVLIEKNKKLLDETNELQEENMKLRTENNHLTRDLRSTKEDFEFDIKQLKKKINVAENEVKNQEQINLQLLKSAKRAESLSDELVQTKKQLDECYSILASFDVGFGADDE
eukprot:TRINITY_DN2819_c0_g1_i1.p1 TRINITY_DN2819_c0_g1~~TRINITY_DN2819_c0_g1_i1.p1  ORF type:complete len:857 (-),score=294.57 TRINITY_DN2819_c0_g1_i1:13-2583(-)